MLYVATTRFTEKTWDECSTWMKKREKTGCVYNSPMRISDTVPIRAHMFIVEMNNDRNKVMGIGLIRNTLGHCKKVRIYQDHYYNRYCYRGEQRLDRSELLAETVLIEGVSVGLLRLLEVLCFMGSTHSKRNRGISLLPKQVIDNGYISLEVCIKKLFNKWLPHIL
jgi:hypothetical protein